MQKRKTNFDKKIEIDEIIRIWKYTKDRKRPIQVKLARESTRSKILENAKSLKVTELWIMNE